MRRPLVEWALRRAAAAEPGVKLVSGRQITCLVPGASGFHLDDGQEITADVVVDALGRYRCPPGWPRASAQPSECGAIYYCRYFALNPGGEHVNPRGDLGYMGVCVDSAQSNVCATFVSKEPDVLTRVCGQEPGFPATGWVAASCVVTARWKPM